MIWITPDMDDMMTGSPMDHLWPGWLGEDSGALVQRLGRLRLHRPGVAAAADGTADPAATATAAADDLAAGADLWATRRGAEGRADLEAWDPDHPVPSTWDDLGDEQLVMLVSNLGVSG